MAWGFISRTPSSHHRNALDARSAMPPAMFTFRNSESPLGTEIQLSLADAILILGMIRLKMTNAAR